MSALGAPTTDIGAKQAWGPTSATSTPGSGNCDCGGRPQNAVRLVARAGRQLDLPGPKSLPLVTRIESTPEKLKSRAMLYLLRIKGSI